MEHIRTQLDTLRRERIKELLDQEQQAYQREEWGDLIVLADELRELVLSIGEF